MAKKIRAPSSLQKRLAKKTAHTVDQIRIRRERIAKWLEVGAPIVVELKIAEDSLARAVELLEVVPANFRQPRTRRGPLAPGTVVYLKKRFHEPAEMKALAVVKQVRGSLRVKAGRVELVIPLARVELARGR